jgi:hypothetical protein
VHDIKYVQQHMHKLFELKKEIYTDACEAFPAAAPLALTSGHTGAASGHTGSTQHWAEGTYGAAVPLTDSHPAGIASSNDSAAASGRQYPYNGGSGDGGYTGNRVRASLLPQSL